MTSIPGTDLTTEAARNIAMRLDDEPTARLIYALSDALDATPDPEVLRDNTLVAAIARAKNTADRDKYSPQEAAAAWDVVDALQTLRSSREHVTPDPDQDDRDGKQISRAAEAHNEGADDCD